MDLRLPTALAALLCLLLVAAPPTPSPAEGTTIYTWTDSRGHLHATRNLLSVPREQRADARRRAHARRPSRLQTFRAHDGPRTTPPAAAVAATRRGVEISFQRRGTLMVVDVLLNDHVRAPFLVDTGASGISVPDKIVRQLGIRIDADTPRLAVQTAAGIVSEPVVKLASVQVGGARVEHLDALVNSSMDIGLLGGSFFNNFVYEVDAASQRITLRPNDAVRAGMTSAQWRARFQDLRVQEQRLERYLEENDPRHEGRRAEIDGHLERVRGELAALEREANGAGVPRAWRQ